MIPDPRIRDRLRDTFSRDELERIAYLAWRVQHDDAGARRLLAELLRAVDPPTRRRSTVP